MVLEFFNFDSHSKVKCLRQSVPIEAQPSAVGTCENEWTIFRYNLKEFKRSILVFISLVKIIVPTMHVKREQDKISDLGENYISVWRSSHAMTSPVTHYSMDTRKNEIYLLNRHMSVCVCGGGGSLIKQG